MIRIGTSGWKYDNWVDKFYPEDVQKDSWLHFYAKHFNSVEVNNSFYNTLDDDTLSNWQEQVPKSFDFTIKANRYITHMKKLKEPQEALEKFYDSLKPLQQSIGCILWQLPGNQHNDIEKFERFLELIDHDYQNVFEFRHKSWSDDDIYELLEQAKATICIMIAPSFQEQWITTSKTAYIRFHGKQNWYKDKFTSQDLRSYSEKISQLKATHKYVYFNNDKSGFAAENAKELKSILTS